MPGKRFLLVVFMFALAACQPAAPETIEPPPTSPPTETAIPPTDTPIPPTNTPVPTPTDTPEPTATPTETPTETPDLEATAAYESTQAAAEMVDVIEAVISLYGYSTDTGSLGWVQEGSQKITVTGYDSATSVDLAPEFSDYILYVDVTWDSTSGLAGCGITFRTDLVSVFGAHYRFQALRLSGAPAWDVEYWDLGSWQSTTTGEVKFHNAIDVSAGATNSYLLIIEGSTATIYANGTRIGAVTVTQRTSGRSGFLTFQESGETTCTFANGWIWDLAP